MNGHVTFTVCRRPEYLRPVLRSWARVRGLADWEFSFYVEPTDQVMAQLGIIQEFSRDIGQPVRTVVNPDVLGVLVNPWYALDDAFATGADFTVLAEEDLVVSSDVLEMFGWAAREFSGKPVGAVCANKPGPEDPGHEHLLALRDHFSPHVWGTWNDRWWDTIRDTWDKDYSSGGAMDSGWDWNLDKRVFPAARLRVLAPLESRSDNIGQYGGVHQVPSAFGATKAVTFRPDREPVKYQVAEEVSA